MASRLKKGRFQWPALRVKQVPSAFSGALGTSRWSNIGTSAPPSCRPHVLANEDL